MWLRRRRKEQTRPPRVQDKKVTPDGCEEGCFGSPRGDLMLLLWCCIFGVKECWGIGEAGSGPTTVFFPPPSSSIRSRSASIARRTERHSGYCGRQRLCGAARRRRIKHSFAYWVVPSLCETQCCKRIFRRSSSLLFSEGPPRGPPHSQMQPSKQPLAQRNARPNWPFRATNGKRNMKMWEAPERNGWRRSVLGGTHTMQHLKQVDLHTDFTVSRTPSTSQFLTGDTTLFLVFLRTPEERRWMFKSKMNSDVFKTDDYQNWPSPLQPF